MRLRGRIDRVDVGAIGGRTVFNVVDYKSSGKFAISHQTIVDGLTLQLPLYALAIEQLLLADRDAVPWQAGYWLVKKQGFDHRNALKFHHYAEGLLQADEAWPQLREQLLARVVALVQGIRRGEFPMNSADEKCTSHCHFNTVCRVGQVRALEKKWPPSEAKT